MFDAHIQMPLVLILGDNPFEVVDGVSPLADLQSISSLAILDAHNLDPNLLPGKKSSMRQTGIVKRIWKINGRLRGQVSLQDGRSQTPRQGIPTANDADLAVT